MVNLFELKRGGSWLDCVDNIHQARTATKDRKTRKDVLKIVMTINMIKRPDGHHKGTACVKVV